MAPDTYSQKYSCRIFWAIGMQLLSIALRSELKNKRRDILGIINTWEVELNIVKNIIHEILLKCLHNFLHLWLYWGCLFWQRKGFQYCGSDVSKPQEAVTPLLRVFSEFTQWLGTSSFQKFISGDPELLGGPTEKKNYWSHSLCGRERNDVLKAGIAPNI